MRSLYFHIPFCKSKCSYCDFYSFYATKEQKDSYLKAVLSCIDEWKNKERFAFDTIYFGGGTPSFFGGERLSAIIQKSREAFEISNEAEITVECNPSSVTKELIKTLKESGVNRISMGLQSAVTKERQALSRLSSSEQAKEAISLCKKYGIENISLDLMLGIPLQTKETLNESLDFIINSGAKHASVYMLKLENETPLFKNKDRFSFPDEDSVCDMYLQTVDRLEKAGFLQYEISNFSKVGYESQHNLRYWHDEEYLGIGPSAHSFINGKRFYYSRDFESFINGCEPIFDSLGGDEEEYIMLSLRLTEGLSFSKFQKRFSKPFPEKIKKEAELFSKHGYLTADEFHISLTPKGFLVSNYIISKLIETL